MKMRACDTGIVTRTRTSLIHARAARSLFARRARAGTSFTNIDIIIIATRETAAAVNNIIIRQIIIIIIIACSISSLEYHPFPGLTLYISAPPYIMRIYSIAINITHTARSMTPMAVD